MHAALQQHNVTQSRKKEMFEFSREFQEHTMQHSRLRSSRIEEELICFFCELPAGTEGLHEASTLQVDRRVKDSASLLEDSLLLAKLSAGDMVALEAKYHTKCF